MWLAERRIYYTYRTANFRGRRASTGKRKKQRVKQAAAPRLQQAKTSRRSHRLTVIARRNEIQISKVLILHWCGGGGGNGRFAARSVPTPQPPPPPLLAPVPSQPPTSPLATGNRRYQGSVDENKTHMLTSLHPLLDEFGLEAEEEVRRLLEAGHNRRSQMDSGIVVYSRKGMTQKW